jgi:hypothetical protein
MSIIVSEITDLNQYLSVLNEAVESLRPKCCIHCGMANPRHHGHYDRKADRENPKSTSLNPIPILRFYCPHCKHTCSVLPECIPPRRWYLWSVQHMVLLLLALGNSLRAVASRASPSRSTCRRWWNRLQDRFLKHRDALCAKISELGQAIGFNDFWSRCFAKMPLSRAMLVCHLAGVVIP